MSRPTLEALLAEHELQYGPKLGQTCSCGHTAAPTPAEIAAFATQQERHRAHVAAVTREWLRGDAGSLATDWLSSLADEIDRRYEGDGFEQPVSRLLRHLADALGEESTR